MQEESREATPRVHVYVFLSPPEGGLDLVTNRQGAIYSASTESPAGLEAWLGVHVFLLYPPPPLQFTYSAWVGALAHEGATRVEGILNQKSQV